MSWDPLPLATIRATLNCPALRCSHPHRLADQRYNKGKGGRVERRRRRISCGQLAGSAQDNSPVTASCRSSIAGRAGAGFCPPSTFDWQSYNNAHSPDTVRGSAESSGSQHLNCVLQPFVYCCGPRYSGYSVPPSRLDVLCEVVQRVCISRCCKGLRASCNGHGSGIVGVLHGGPPIKAATLHSGVDETCRHPE